MSSEISICRPDSEHWCVECCQGRRCSNLGRLPDGTRGCLGHGGREDLGFPKPPFCQEVNCLREEYSSDAETIGRICQEVARMPPGEFKMSEVLERREICLC